MKKNHCRLSVGVPLDLLLPHHQYLRPLACFLPACIAQTVLLFSLLLKQWMFDPFVIKSCLISPLQPKRYRPLAHIPFHHPLLFSCSFSSSASSSSSMATDSESSVDKGNTQGCPGGAKFRRMLVVLNGTHGTVKQDVYQIEGVIFLLFLLIYSTCSNVMPVVSSGFLVNRIGL